MTKFIYGSYPTFQEAELAVADLIQRGVETNHITIASNSAYVTETTSTSGVEVMTTEIVEEDNTWWDNFLNFFSPDPVATDAPYGKYDEYRELVKNGDVLVLVEERYLADSTNTTETAHDTHATAEATTIKLHEEQLNVRKERETTGEVEITKHVVEETKTIEVPVEREELHITRRTNTGTTADADAFQEETIVVPLTEENVVVDKNTVVTGEVDINKTVETNTHSVSDSVRKEVLDVEGDSQVITDNHTN